MKLRPSIACAFVVLGAVPSPSAGAQEAWLARCNLELSDPARPESGNYLYQTRGKADGAEARAELDYKTSVSARAAVYPTDAKDFLNPFSNLTVRLGYVVAPDGKALPSLGTVSISAIGKDFEAIPGAPISLKLLIDGKAFGPYQPKPVSSGMYSVWLDTGATDGDGKPPMLKQAEFDKLASALRSMKTLGVVLVRDGQDIATGSVPFPQLAAWRDELPAWGARIRMGACDGTRVN